MVTANQATPDTTDEIATDIKAEAALAGQIIERHRTMLRSRQLQKKTIDLNRVIEESVALLAYDMRAREVEATLELSPTPCVIDGDEVLLGQVVVNLLRNAVDALAEMPPPRRHITIGSAVSVAQVEISVCDTGPGLSEETVSTLFTPFVTTKSRGLGVGLTIAQRIVQAHGGTITVRENDDGGATFTVTLPCSPRPRSSQNGWAQQVHPEESVSVDGE
jgi:signal transduction histidine kinase